jgi:4-amino-4-deoxy-L-arabinose transferase-like glycosyltransferase
VSIESDEALAVHVGGPTTRRRPFALPLALATVCGVVARVSYIQLVAPHHLLFPDSWWYFLQAQNLRHGLGYLWIAPPKYGLTIKWRAIRSPATAYWPPGYPVFLAVVQTLFGAALLTSQLAGAATGAATIVLTGLLGRAIAGRSVGIVAAFLVALSPLVIATDGSLMADTLYLPLVLLALLLAHRARTRSTFPAWCALGAAIGAATLVRQDALLLIVFAAVPAAVLSGHPTRDLLPKLALGLGALTLVVGPWVVRNAIEMHTPTISTLSSSVAGGANCKVTYSGREIGWWDTSCPHPELLKKLGEAQYANRVTHRGISYAANHASRLPVVMAARFGRTWGLWNPVNEARLESPQSRNYRWQMFAWPVSLCTLVLGLVGWRMLAVRRRPIALLVAPAAMTTVITLFGYGNTRFRGPAECALAIGAAAAIVGWTRRDNHPGRHRGPLVVPLRAGRYDLGS